MSTPAPIPRHCPRCGRDLSSQGHRPRIVCPDCGGAFTASELSSGSPRDRTRLLAALLVTPVIIAVVTWAAALLARRGTWLAPDLSLAAGPLAGFVYAFIIEYRLLTASLDTARAPGRRWVAVLFGMALAIPVVVVSSGLLMLLLLGLRRL